MNANAWQHPYAAQFAALADAPLVRMLPSARPGYEPWAGQNKVHFYKAVQRLLERGELVHDFDADPSGHVIVLTERGRKRLPVANRPARA